MGVGRRRAPTIWQMPDELWLIVQYVLPSEELQRSHGRPWIPPRRILDGVLYVLRTGCQWKAIPKSFGSGSTCHLRLTQWREAGVFRKIHAQLVVYYDKKRGLRWDWSSLDSATVKAPKGGAKRAPVRRIGPNSA